MTNGMRDALLRAFYPGRDPEYLRLLYGEQLRGFERRLREGGYTIEPIPEEE